MSDRMRRKGISLDIEQLEKQLKQKLPLISTRENTGIDQLKKYLLDYRSLSKESITDIRQIDTEYFENLEKVFPDQSLYKLWLVITQDVNFTSARAQKVQDATNYKTQTEAHLKRLQQKETIKRYQLINNALKETYAVDINKATDFRSRLDRVLIHRFWGYIIFFVILLTIFQVIFDWSSIPMDFIDETFTQLSEATKANLPPGLFTDLLAEGIIAGLGGIVIFIPQIAFSSSSL